MLQQIIDKPESKELPFLNKSVYKEIADVGTEV